jgi:hypothetical protein
VIDLESARLGLAAEHPDRTGPPRRPALADAPMRRCVLAAKQPIDRALNGAPLNSRQANFVAVLEVLAELVKAKPGALTRADREELANIPILTSREMTTNGRVKTLVKRIGLSPALKRRRLRNQFEAGFAGDTPTPRMKALVRLGMLERTLLTPERIMRELRARPSPRTATERPTAPALALGKGQYDDAALIARAMAAFKSGKFRSRTAAALSFVADIPGGGSPTAKAKRIGRKADKLGRADKNNSS